MSRGTTGISFLAGLVRRAAGHRQSGHHALETGADLRLRPELPAPWLPEASPESVVESGDARLVPEQAAESPRPDGPIPIAAVTVTPHGRDERTEKIEKGPTGAHREERNHTPRNVAGEARKQPPPAGATPAPQAAQAPAATSVANEPDARSTPLSRATLPERPTDRVRSPVGLAAPVTAEVELVTRPGADLGQPTTADESSPRAFEPALVPPPARARLEPAPSAPNPVDRFFRDVVEQPSADEPPRVEVYIDRIDVASTTPPPPPPTFGSSRAPRAARRGFAALEGTRRHLGRRWY